MVKDGIYYGVGLFSAGLLISFVFSPAWAIPLFILGVFCLWFFRDPERTAPDGPVAVSAADGVVTHIRESPDGGVRISVFLNIFNVHVNRSPYAGRITSVEYKAGRFKMAHLEEASERNEQNTLVIEPSDGLSGPIEFKQIAGLVARRIVCYKRVGDNLQKGERFGMIKFGSRADVRFGPEWEAVVKRGDKVVAGETPIARLKGRAERAE